MFMFKGANRARTDILSLYRKMSSLGALAFKIMYMYKHFTCNLWRFEESGKGIFKENCFIFFGRKNKTKENINNCCNKSSMYVENFFEVTFYVMVDYRCNTLSMCNKLAFMLQLFRMKCLLLANNIARPPSLL